MNSNIYIDYIKYRILLRGASRVGKTSIINQYIDNTFTSQYTRTQKTDFKSKYMQYKDYNIILQLWDCKEEVFSYVYRDFLSQVQAVALIFDITNRDTFDELEEKIKDIKTHTKENIIIYVIGNKSDLNGIRIITRKEAEKFCLSMGCPYFECSAMNGKNINEIMHRILRDIISINLYMHYDIEDTEEENKEKLQIEFMKEKSCIIY